MNRRFWSLLLAMSLCISLLPMVANAAAPVDEQPIQVQSTATATTATVKATAMKPTAATKATVATQATAATAPTAMKPTAATKATIATRPTRPYEGITLQIYGMGTETTYTDFYMFNETFPWMQKAAAVEWAEMNGVTLEFKGAYDQSNILSDINSGGAPDIIYQSNMFPGISNMGLTAAFTQSEYNRLASIAGPEWLDLMRYGNDCMGFVVPWTGTMMCYYNKTMFDDYGVTTPKEHFQKGNWTWEQFAETMAEMTLDADSDGTIDTYGLNGSSWNNIVNPWAINSQGELISTIDEPWMYDYFQLKYDAYTVHKSTRAGKMNIQTNVIYPMFAMQFSDCEPYNFEHWYQYIPNGNELEVAPVPEWRGANGETLGTSKVTQQAFHLCSATDERDAAVNLLTYILKCGMKYMEDYSFGLVETEYEGLQGTSTLSAEYLNAFAKMNKRRQRDLNNLIQDGIYKADYITEVNAYLADRDRYISQFCAGVSVLTDYSEIVAVPPESAIPAIKTKYQNALNTYNNLYLCDSLSDSYPTFTPVDPDEQPTGPTVSLDNLSFSLVNDEGYCITYCSPSAYGALHIPATYEGMPVISIGESAFENCEGLTRVVIPDGVVAIGDCAFSECYNLRSITIPDSVTYIGARAFYWCNNLTGITIPEGITTIKEHTFFWCESLTSVTIPDSVTTIEDCAFYCCTTLTSVTIPDSVTTIGMEAFYSCDNLSSINIGNSLKQIGDYAFSACGNAYIWVSTDNPYYSSDRNGVLYNKDQTTLVCAPGITGSYTIPSSVTHINSHAFYACNLKKVTIPDNVISIGYEAFRYCSSLTDVVISDSVTTIHEFAFQDCSKLANVTLGYGITDIYDGAFSGCFRLTNVYYNGTPEQWGTINFHYDNQPLLNATLHYVNACVAGHSWNSGRILKAATCKDTGIKFYTCTVCQDTKSEIIVKTNTHTYTNNSDTSCNICSAVAYPGGDTLVYEKGDWYHVVNRQKVFDTTLVYFSGKWYYVKNGVLDRSNTLCRFSGKWYHVKDGAVVYDTTLVYWNSKWYYVKNGVVDYSNTLCKWNGMWFHVKDGNVVYDTTLVNYGGYWFYVKNGQVDFNATTLCYFGSAWYYVKGGQVNYSNTLCNWNGKWYHVNNGKVVYDTTLVYFGSKWYYVKSGVLDYSNTLCYWNNKWYHVKDGTVVYDTTLVYWGSKWYYVKSGVVNQSNTLCNWNGKWYHVKNGTVVYDTTLVYFGSNWYYVKSGVVDFNYSGRVLFAGSYYTVKKGVKV